MTCTDCEHHVTAALEQAGAEQFSADFRRGLARFTWPESAGEAALRAAVARAGYTPGRLRAESPGTAAALGGEADYDLLVLGAGSAAFAAAIRGRDAGYRVALAEAGTLGGTCVNVGCIPSKALLAAGAAYWAAGHPRFAGITTSAGLVDLAALVAQKDDLVAALRQEKYAGLVDAYGFDVLPGHAAFTGPDTVEVDGRAIRPGAVLIATGASPAAPPIPGLSGAGYLTSTTALDLKAVPRRLAVIGANAVGLELGQFFLHLGSAVIFVDVADRIAPFEEPEVSQALAGVLAGQGATIHAPAQVLAVERDGDMRRIRAAIGGAEIVIDADEVLVATGRAPNSAGLGLQAAGVATDGRGARTRRVRRPRGSALPDTPPAGPAGPQRPHRHRPRPGRRRPDRGTGRGGLPAAARRCRLVRPGPVPGRLWLPGLAPRLGPHRPQHGPGPGPPQPATLTGPFRPARTGHGHGSRRPPAR